MSLRRGDVSRDEAPQENSANVHQVWFGCIVVSPLVPKGRTFCHTILTSVAHDGQERTLRHPSSPFRIHEVLSDPVVAAFIAGGTAGAVSRTIVSPLERLKILYQVQSAGRNEYKLSIGKALIKMGKDEGWRGFLRGNGTNCIRIIPYSAVQFGSYSCYRRVSRLIPFRFAVDADIS